MSSGMASQGLMSEVELKGACVGTDELLDLMMEEEFTIKSSSRSNIMNQQYLNSDNSTERKDEC